MSGYFDPDYFASDYFDTGDTGGSPRKRARFVPEDPQRDDALEALLLADD